MKNQDEQFISRVNRVKQALSLNLTLITVFGKGTLNMNGHLCDKKASVENWYTWPQKPRNRKILRFVGSDMNLGVHCGFSNILVVDVNVKNGEKGLNSLGRYSRKQNDYNFNDTFTVKTPSGGFHYYFRLPKGCIITGNPNEIGPGIKTLTGKSYVLLFGSEVLTGKNTRGKRQIGGKYYILYDNKIQNAPTWLMDKIGNIIYPVIGWNDEVSGECRPYFS